MSKPKVPKLKHEPSSQVLDRELQTHPQISKDDWDRVFSYRQFRSGTEAAVKLEISIAISAFMRMNSGYDNLDERRSKLQDLLTIATAARDEAYAFAKYNEQRWIVIGRIREADSTYDPMLLSQDAVNKFYSAADTLSWSIRQLIVSMGKSRPGPSTGDIFWLVKVLNRIVVQYSDGGPVTRSEKNRAGVGNDRDFVKSVLEIASREAGRAIDSGTITGAIRALRSSTEERLSQETVLPADRVKSD